MLQVKQSTKEKFFARPTNAGSTLKQIYGQLWIRKTCLRLYQPNDRSIRGDMSVIRCEFETQNVGPMIWIAGKINYADACTKENSPLVQALQTILFTAEDTIDFSADAERRTSEQFFG